MTRRRVLAMPLLASRLQDSRAEMGRLRAFGTCRYPWTPRVRRGSATSLPMDSSSLSFHCCALSLLSLSPDRTATYHAHETKEFTSVIWALGVLHGVQFALLCGMRHWSGRSVLPFGASRACPISAKFLSPHNN